MVGRVISHYEIIEKLGAGGMGTVYKARDTKLNRFVAIKFLHRLHSPAPEDERRFFREAETASLINHPNVCVIHEIDEVDEETYIVMEFVDGVTLRQWIREKVRTTDGIQQYLPEALRIATQIGEGLSEAHRIGVIHRDVKSENVMVTPNGRPILMDFGLAKLKGMSTLTRIGTPVGTIAYMSPEQVQGLDVDRRTDVFSFGVVLYELLTGVLPFKGEHETALIYEILNVNPARVSDLQGSVDPELDQVVMKCLEKDLNDRYQSLEDVLGSLKTRFDAKSSSRKPIRPQRIKGGTKDATIDRFPRGSGDHEGVMHAGAKKSSILVVEDDASVRQGLVELLISDGHIIKTASDGIRALSTLKGESPDLVLLDINLPGISGFEVLRRAREDGYSGPVIMLTSRTDQIDKIMGLEIGAVDYITKPFEGREVVARVRAQLRANRVIAKSVASGSEEQTRKTLSIMFTDMKDFSKIMNRDERKGISILKAQNQRIEKAVARYSGSIIEIIGDSYFVSFESALQAVDCGIAIQTSLRRYNKKRARKDHIQVRIGINLGDVTRERGRLRGDAVNIAARLQQMARPEYVTMSQSVYESVKGRVTARIFKLGRRKFKNIRQFITVYQTRG